MYTLFKNGEVFVGGRFEKVDLLVAGSKISHVGPFDERAFPKQLELEVVDCKNHYLSPGFIDSQSLLAGGSGESGFLSQTPRILLDECIYGGVTTSVGTIGADTITKTMSNLFASVRAHKEAGLSAFAYTGGYEIPPKTLTGTSRTDILFVDEIIGVGELAIADRRAPEPTPNQLARIVSESYVAGILSGKAGITRVHVGEGQRRLATIREMSRRHEFKWDSLYLTHIERSKELVVEGIELAKKGTFLDFDIHENDMPEWYEFYLESGGPLNKLSFSSDAGISSPREIWNEVVKCSQIKKSSFAQMIPHMTEVPASALKLKSKGQIAKGFDADVLVVDKNELRLIHVMANGKFFLKDETLQREDQDYTKRRRMDWYGPSQ